MALTDVCTPRVRRRCCSRSAPPVRLADTNTRRAWCYPGLRSVGPAPASSTSSSECHSIESAERPLAKHPFGLIVPHLHPPRPLAPYFGSPGHVKPGPRPVGSAPASLTSSSECQSSESAESPFVKYRFGLIALCCAPLAPTAPSRSVFRFARAHVHPAACSFLFI